MKMKKQLLWVLVLAMSISLVVVFSLVGGCKPTVSPVEEPVVEEQVEEVTGEPEEEAVVEEEVAEEEEEFGLKALIMEQEWVGLPAGSEVTINEESFTVARDLAGVEATLKIQNNSPGVEILFPPINLERADGTIVEPFHLRQLDGTEISNDWPDEGIKFEPNQTRVLKLASTLTEISECKGELFINHHQYKWELKVDPLPPSEELYKVEEESVVEEEVVEEEEGKALPTYSQVLNTYPANTELCQTEADIMGGDDNGLSLSGSISIRNGQFVYQCYGTKLTVRVQVTLEGKTYKPGTKLTVDKDLNWIEVSSWD